MPNLEDILLRDTRANQPAATDVAEGSLYYVTDESVTEQSRGGVWVDYSDAGAGGSGIDQLTGDVTAGPGSGSQAATIANNAVTTAKILDANVTTAKILDANVTLAKIANVAADRIIGRGNGGGAGVPQELSLGSGLFLTGTTLNTSAPISIGVGRVVLTDAQIKTINTVPVQILAAPGAGIIAIPLEMVLIKDTTSGAYNSTSNLSLKYSTDGANTALVTAVNPFFNAANKRFMRAGIAALTIGANPFLNDSIVVFGNTDLSLGNAANYCAIEFVYILLEDGP